MRSGSENLYQITQRYIPYVIKSFSIHSKNFKSATDNFFTHLLRFLETGNIA